jgi:hypothetical protein
MTTTSDETKAKEARMAKAAADKASYTALAKWHEAETKRYLEKASACDELELVSMPSAGAFGGL